MSGTEDEDPYPCVGVCMVDPDTGYCLGCGRPPAEGEENGAGKPEQPPASDDTDAAPAENQ